MKLVSGFLLLLFCGSLNGQPIYSPKQLSDDLKILQHIILHTYPAASQSERNRFLEKWDSLVARRPMKEGTAIDLLRLISKSDLAVHYDDHAGIILKDEAYPTGPGYFPLPVYALDGHLLVNAEGTEIPFGSIIENINGRAASSILDTLIGSQTMRHFREHHLFRSFPVLYYLKWGASYVFNIRYRSPGAPEIIQTAAVKSLNLTQWLQMRQQEIYPLSRDHPSPPLTARYEQQTQTYYLRISRFTGESSDTIAAKEKFRSRLDSLFADVNDKNPKELILDIRDNGGGLMDLAALLFSYLGDTILKQSFDLKMPPVKKIPLHHLKQIDLQRVLNGSDARKKLYRLYDGFQGQKTFACQHLVFEIPKPTHPYKGKASLLMNGGSFSAAVYFAALFRQHNRGIIYGSPAGGNIRHLTAGHILMYELPHSGLLVQVPLMLIDLDRNFYNFNKEGTVHPDIKPDFGKRYKNFLEKKDLDTGALSR
ncbi:hypothetical protein GCM10027051_02730 [Niabella terrae]